MALDTSSADFKASANFKSSADVRRRFPKSCSAPRAPRDAFAGFEVRKLDWPVLQDCPRGSP
jgi:hypothetical protein